MAPGSPELEAPLGVGVGGPPDGVPARDVLGKGDGEKLPGGPGVPLGVGVWDLMTVPGGAPAKGEAGG